MSTVALSMIVKDEYKEVSQIISDAINYVDEINLVVSDRKTATALQTVAKPFSQVNVKYRKWNNHFDDARNVAMDMCTTDYFFWIDADDSFDFTAIEEMKRIADENNIDAIFLPYNYMYDGEGNLVARHWRERLIRLGRGYEWRGWVHETCISEEKPTTHMIDFPVIHNATVDSIPESLERNHKILEEAYAATEDPRYLHYLGMSHFSKGDYEEAIELLNNYLEVGNSEDDIYRALSTISEAAYKLGAVQSAIEYAMKCISMKPEYPQGYWMVAQYESDQENHEEALRWVRTSETIPDPETLSVWDPSARQRATWIAARSLFLLNRFTEAFEELKKIRGSEEADTVWEDFLTEASKEKFVKLLPSLQQFFRSDEHLYHALTPEMRYDARLRPLRHRATKPRVWDDKSIVIFCGQGFEEWGPQTLDKGMGGSEEAVVYLSRELGKLGYDVTVYGEVDEAIYDSPRVLYRPWKEIDTRDSFNIFVSWRQPLYIEHINAKVKLVDIHDVLPKEIVKNFPDVTYLVKSEYHSDLLPEDVDRKVIGNGILKEQFHG